MQFSECGYGVWKFHEESIKIRLERVLAGLKRVEKEGIKFDGVALMGTSGIWLAPLLVMNGYDVVLVRKEGELSHGQRCEGKAHKDFRNVVFVDDLICSGATLRSVQNQLEEEARSKAVYLTPSESSPIKIVAIVLHDQMDDDCYKGVAQFGYQ